MAASGASLMLVLTLTGCGAGNFFDGHSPAPPDPIVPYSGPTFAVAVRAGSAPMIGAAVQFYTAGSTGNGSAPTALLSAAVKTDGSGAALVPANYTCPTSNGMVYLVATGGAVGASTATNPNAAMIAAIGPCSSVTTGTSVIINEASTVAAAYALQAFYAAGGIGASATNLTGLTNAFATAATLANVSSGSFTGTTLPGNGVSPAARLSSVANALNACTISAANCAALYSEAPAGNPATTMEAVFDLARYPGKNVRGIYQASLLSNAYGAGLGAQPLDWTVFITFSGGGLSSPSGIALDSTGNVWVANYFYAASKFSPTGAPIFANGVLGIGLNNSYGAAVDLKDNAWIPNEQPYSAQGIGSITVITPSGTSAAGPSGYTAGGLSYPISIAIDPNGTAWVVDYGNSHLTLLSPSGTPLSGPTGYTTPLFAFPVVVAVDGNHNGWVGNQADTTVTRVSPDGTNFQNYNCCDGASGIAIDAGNNVWVANFYGNSVSLINSAGTVVANQAYTGNGNINHPQGIAVDGVGNVFVANFRAPYLTELTGTSSGATGTPLSPPLGLGGDAQLLEPFALAVDASGNVWVSNQGSSTITKYVGLGAPVKTPLSGLPKLP